MGLLLAARALRSVATLVAVAALLTGYDKGFFWASALYLAAMAIGGWAAETFILNIMIAAEKLGAGEDSDK